MEFRFRIPSGATEDLEDPGPVLDRVRNAGAEFWNIGSGDAAVETGSVYEPLMLELYFDGHDHFQLRYTPPGEYPLIAQDPKHGKEAATIKVGGTPMKLAAGTLLDRDAAAQIVRHFCETGEKHPDFTWK